MIHDEFYYRIRTEIDSFHPGDRQKVDAIMDSIQPILEDLVNNIRREYISYEY